MAQVVGILGQDRYFAIFSVALMFLGIGYLIGAPIFPIVQVDQLHLSYSEIGRLGLLSSLMWMLSTMVMGRLLDRKGALAVMLIANVMQMIVPLCYFLAADVRMVAVAYVCLGISMAAGDLGWPNSVLLFARRGQGVRLYGALYAAARRAWHHWPGHRRCVARHMPAWGCVQSCSSPLPCRLSGSRLWCGCSARIDHDARVLV